MEYTFDVYRLDENDTPFRVETFARVEGLRRYASGVTFHKIFATCQSGNGYTVELLTRDDVVNFLEERARAATWKPEPVGAIDVKNITAADNVQAATTNLKNIAAIGKPTISDVPPIGLFSMGAAMSDGAKKYGRFNWRTTEVTSSVFFDAMMRHLLAWYMGEDHAQDSSVHHLGHLQAGAAIVLDAELYGVLRDDRDKSKFDAELLTKMLDIIKKRKV